MAREFKDTKEMMSLLSNELIKIKLDSSQNQGNHPRQLAAQNNYSQNQRRDFGLYGNIKNENNGIRGMIPSKNGYSHNYLSDQPPQIIEGQPF